jgi:hypothetical protein
LSENAEGRDNESLPDRCSLKEQTACQCALDGLPCAHVVPKQCGFTFHQELDALPLIWIRGAAGWKIKDINEAVVNRWLEERKHKFPYIYTSPGYVVSVVSMLREALPIAIRLFGFLGLPRELRKERLPRCFAFPAKALPRVATSAQRHEEIVRNTGEFSEQLSSRFCRGWSEQAGACVTRVRLDGEFYSVQAECRLLAKERRL